MSYLLNLPNERIEDILIRLSYGDLLNACQTNVQLNSICHNELFWKRKVYNDFSDWDSYVFPKHIYRFNWRTIYDFLYNIKQQKIIYVEGVNLLYNESYEFIFLISGLYYVYKRTGDYVLLDSGNLLKFIDDFIYEDKKYNDPSYIKKVILLGEKYEQIKDPFFNLCYSSNVSTDSKKIRNFLRNDKNFNLYSTNLISSIADYLSELDNINICEISMSNSIEKLIERESQYHDTSNIKGILELSRLIDTIDNLSIM